MNMSNLPSLLLALTITFSAAPGGAATEALDFTYTMDTRYGIDLNNNGLIDLPNSRKYVLNENYNNSHCQCLQPDCTPTFKVNLKARLRALQRIEEDFEPIKSFNGAKFTWSVSYQNGKSKIIGNEQDISTCLTEGEHKITLKLQSPNIVQRSVRKKIHIEDILIVQLGDSFASGQGNPERLHRNGIILPNKNYDRTLAKSIMESDSQYYPDYKVVGWADDGEQHGTKFVSTSYQPGGLFTFILGMQPKYANYSKIMRDHDAANRSSYTASSQWALDLEKASTLTSVTYVNLAKTGAVVKDIYANNYRGTNLRLFPDHQSKAQLTQLKKLLGVNGVKRDIDYLLVSAGGNDIGFSKILTSLVVHRTSPLTILKYKDIRGGILSGQWRKVQKVDPILRTMDKWKNTTGLNRLADQYEKLANALSRFSIKNTLITPYPDPTAKCSEILKSATPKLLGMEISSPEIEWARNNALKPLTEAIKTAANKHQWQVVSGITKNARGLCGAKIDDPTNYKPSLPISQNVLNKPLKWFRGFKMAAKLQYAIDGISDGPVHPNRVGHRFIANKIAATAPIEPPHPATAFIESPNFVWYPAVLF